MDSALIADLAPPRSGLRDRMRKAGGRLALAVYLLAGSGCAASAAGLLGGSHGSPVPNLAPLSTPDTGSISAPGTGSIPNLGGSGSPVDPGTALGPNLSVPLAPTSPLAAPSPNLPNAGSDLPGGLSPALKDLSKNLEQHVARTRNAGQPIRNGFVIPPPGERRLVANEIVLHLPTMPGRTLDAIARRHRLTLLGSRPLSLTGHTIYRWRIDDGRTVADVIRELGTEQRISAAQPNFTFTLQDARSSREGDPAQYAVAKLHLTEAHRLANGENVLVAVIDSGIDGSHPELAGVIAGTYDAVTGEERPDAHGTAIAGAIAAHARLIGVAPRVRLLAIRAFGTGAAPEGTSFGILAGLDWAVQHGARIVNMSFAGPEDPVLRQALGNARKQGVVLIAAAGNAGPDSAPAYPGADPNVIAVTATDKDDRVFAMANRGSYVALAAPGVDILTAAPNGAMQLATGTSVAAAHVSGIAALLIERKPSLRPDEVRKVLMSTAHRVGARPRDDAYGAGLADALDAISAVQPKSAAK